MAARVQSGNDGSEVLLIHSGATGGRCGAISAPDMKENGGTGPDFRGFRIVADEQLDAVGIVVLAHLFLLFPSGTGRVVQSDVAIIQVGVGRVAYPQICRAYLNVGNTGVVLHGLFVGDPQATQTEYAGGGAKVALALNCCQPRITVQAQPPHQTVATKSSLPRSQHAHPLTMGIFLNK